MEKDIEDIKKKKLKQLKEQMESQEDQEEMEDQYEAQKKALLRSLLTPEARERLARLRMARPEMTESIEQQLIMLAQRGAVQGKIDDETLKNLLKKLTDKKKEINIKRR
ncbi:MAG: DNA-binding protein [Thermoplasmata archaeon]